MTKPRAKGGALAHEMENDETHVWTDPTSTEFTVLAEDAVPSTVADVIAARYRY